MGFKRAIAPSVAPAGEVLTAAMVGIGLNFAAAAAKDPNIEDTLIFASMEAMERDDLRVLSLLVTWFGVHCSWVNADRLTKLVLGLPPGRERALWSALARWQAKDSRLARLAKAYRGARIDLLREGTAFQIQRHGEDPRFLDTCLRVPGKVLRDRAVDVQSPGELASRHRGYRCRIIMGPSFRADMWAVLEEEPTLSASDLARRTYGSFATAWHVRRDFALVHSQAQSARRDR
jgi:hypothetical protein